MSRNRRENPRFSISMWNCFSRVGLDLPCTDNAVEEWHNDFHVRIVKILFILPMIASCAEYCWRSSKLLHIYKRHQKRGIQYYFNLKSSSCRYTNAKEAKTIRQNRQATKKNGTRFSQSIT